jgi:beta-glucosidase
MPGDEAFDSGNSFWGANLTVAVLNGTVPQWRVDDMATRIMAAWYYVGRDTNNPPAPNFSSWTLATNGPRYYFSGTGQQVINQHVNVQGNHAQQVLTQAIRGTVLLKNTHNALPLTGQEKSLAIIGEDAGINRLGPNGCGDRGCDMGTMVSYIVQHA